MKYRRVAIFFLLVICGLLRPQYAGEPSASGAPAGPDWSRRTDLNVRGATFGEVVSQISRQTGVMLQPTKELAGQDQQFWKEPCYLQLQGATLRQAVEWVARMLGCRYRVEGVDAGGNYKIMLDSSFGWVDSGSSGLILENFEALLGDHFDVAALDRQFTEVFKFVSLLDSGFYTRLEEHGKQVKLVAQLPGDLAPFFSRALKSLEQRGQSVPAQVSRPLEKAEVDLIGRLNRPVVAAYRQRPLDEVAADLAGQGGINIGFDQALFRGRKLPLVTLDKGSLTLREAIEGLAKAAGLPGVEISLPGGVWLSRTPANWTRMASRETAWSDTAQARLYYVGDFREGLDGELLAHQIRSRIMPEAWQDPLVSITFHPPGGNLLVIAGPQLQDEVQQALARYRQQGLPGGTERPPAMPGPAAVSGGGNGITTGAGR